MATDCFKALCLAVVTLALGSFEASASGDRLRTAPYCPKAGPLVPASSGLPICRIPSVATSQFAEPIARLSFQATRKALCSSPMTLAASADPAEAAPRRLIARLIGPPGRACLTVVTSH